MPVNRNARPAGLFEKVEVPRVDDLIAIFSTRGDLAHLALFLWASATSALSWFALRELAAAMRRFDDFVRELARFNKRFGGKSNGHASHDAPRHTR